MTRIAACVLFLSLGSAASAQIAVAEKAGEVIVTRGGKPVLVYNVAVDESPDPAKPYYRRSGYIHPIYDPAGRIVTDDFPPDHMHQHALMSAWTKCLFDGQPVNFWDQHNGKGTVLHGGMLELKPDGFRAGLDHIVLHDPAKPVTAAKETWTVRVHDQTGEANVFDIESVQVAASDKPLEVQQYHYGGMAVRGARQWFEKGKGGFLTSEGKDRIEGNHTRPRWVSMFGEIDGNWSTITVLCHPDNFRAPQPVRLHPTKPYFSWSPNVLGGFDITKDKPLVSRFRYIVTMGKPDVQAIEKEYGRWLKVD